MPCCGDRLKMAALLDDACLFVEYEMRGPEEGRKALKERSRVIQVTAEMAQATAQHPRPWGLPVHFPSRKQGGGLEESPSVDVASSVLLYGQISRPRTASGYFFGAFDGHW